MTHSNAHSSFVVRMVAAVLVASGMFFASANTSTAQTSLIHHTITHAVQHPPSMGRDFWFSMMSNYWGQDLGGKYMRIYITSPNNTVAYVASEGTVTPVPVQALKVGSFKVPEFWEMESSGLVEDKAIHVYSYDADLTVYDMSHNPYTSDGSYIIPTIGWGTDYVVAAYGSLFEGFGTYVYDLPSTLAVTADEDNTVVSITPSVDCRQCSNGSASGNADASIVVYPAGGTYQWTLNRGQDLQLMPVKASDPDNFDLTGSIIHSSQPVGVSGGSVCPNIPADFPYCDHVEDMIPPVRTWAETYYATNWTQPPGSPDDYTRFLFIASQPGQTIWRDNWQTGPQVECVIPNQYGFYWDELEQGQKFYSNAPFLLVGYINSATYPGGQNGNGDPAECVINPKENFTDTVVFQTPQSVGNIVPYTNYANIIVNDSDARYTYFDNKQILGLSSTRIDDTFEIFLKPLIAPGAHVVENRRQGMTGMKSHGGVGTYIYGYGYDESYAWTGGFGTGTFHSPDTVAPLVDTINECFNAFVHLSDSGLLPDGVHLQSGLSEIRLDSVYNMNYLPDVPPFIEGSGADTSGYDVFPVDETKEGYLRVEVYDLAGNETIIVSTYKPLVDSIRPELNNLGVALPGITNYGYDTIYNYGETTIHFTDISLKLGNQGFKIDSADLSPMAPGTPGHPTFRLIKISFQALKTTKAVDTVDVSTNCNLITAAVIGSGGAQDFTVTSYKWTNVLLTQPSTCYKGFVLLENLSGGNLTVDSVSWPDSHFSAISSLPMTIAPSPAHDTFYVQYCPDSGSLTNANRTQGRWVSNQVLAAGKPDPRFDSLIGNAIAPAETFVQDVVDTVTCAKPGDSINISFTIAATGTSGSTINRVYISGDTTDFTNLIGVLNNGTQTSWKPDSVAQTLAGGSSATISVTYTPPVAQNRTDIVHLIAVDGNGDTIQGKSLTATVVNQYFAEQNIPLLNFGLAKYGSGKIFRVIALASSTTQPLIIDSVSVELNKYTQAYSLSNITFPDTIPPGITVFDTVWFDPSFSIDTVQNTIVDILSNACQPQQAVIHSGVVLDGALMNTYTPASILSCDTRLDSVNIENLKLKNGTDDPIDSVVSATIIPITGPSSAFSFPTLSGQSISGLVGTKIDGSGNLASPTTVFVPVLFTPPAIMAPGMQVFVDSLNVIVYSSFTNKYDTITTTISDTAGAVTVTAMASVANQTITSDNNGGQASNDMHVPVQVSLQNGGMTAPIAQLLDITSIKLTYIIPNRNLLSINLGSGSSGFVGVNLPKNWGATLISNPPAVGSQQADTLVYLLSGPAITDADLNANGRNFGYLDFTVDLTYGVSATPINLSEVDIMQGANGTLAGACIQPVATSGNFSLISACGDTTLQLLMKGQGQNITFIGAATPDPATGSNVTIKYANRGATALTLAIYDELGNQVSLPVNNVMHEAGSWQVPCDISKFASGTYTARLSGMSATGPMAVSTQFVVKH